MFRLFPRVGLLAAIVCLSAALRIPAQAQTHTAKNYVFQTLYSFSPMTSVVEVGNVNSDGANPYAGLIMDSSGNLYGTAYNGGVYGVGTVFEYAPDTQTYTTLHAFTFGNDGAYPYASLIMDGSGNLYGTATNGGANDGDGTVFEYAPDTQTFTVLQSLNNNIGGAPRSGLTMDSSGNLYGTTSGGAEGIFLYAPATNSFATLYPFNLETDGGNPIGNMIMDGSGNLYGTTELGGANLDGTVFQYTPATNTYTTLHTFSAGLSGSPDVNSDGGHPYAGLIMDSSGNLYGTTPAGGANGSGTLFKYALATNTFTTLYTFSATTKSGFNYVNSDGADPYGGLIMDGGGNLYGTARQAGAYGGGTVFKYATATSTFTTLYTFETNPNDGYCPYAGLIMDNSGSLYGTTYYGGANDNGTLFVLHPIDIGVPAAGHHSPQGSHSPPPPGGIADTP